LAPRRSEPSSHGHWLKTLGGEGRPLPAEWIAGAPERLTVTWFPRRPRMARGDRLVYYAAGWQCIFAAGEVASDGPLPEGSPTNPTRWPWSVRVHLHLCVPDLTFAPPLDAIGVPPRSLSQHSHIRITPEHYSRAVEALADAARP
jgi:hypothetical protein